MAETVAGRRKMVWDVGFSAVRYQMVVCLHLQEATEQIKSQNANDYIYISRVTQPIQMERSVYPPFSFSC